jgi:hypothetical protein
MVTRPLDSHTHLQGLYVTFDLVLLLLRSGRLFSHTMLPVIAIISIIAGASIADDSLVESLVISGNEAAMDIT